MATKAAAITVAAGIVAASLAQGAVAAEDTKDPSPAQQTTGQPAAVTPSATQPTVAPTAATRTTDRTTAPAPTPTPDPRPAPAPTVKAAPAVPATKAAPAAETPAAEMPAPTASAVAEVGFAVPGAIGAEYKRLGGPGEAVGPATACQDCGLTGGGCLQTFTNGTIVWSTGTGAHLIAGAHETGWLKYGGPKSYLGYPLAAASCVGTAAGSVCHQKFQRGSLYNVTGTGTYPVWGGINATYESLGGIKGYLGYPKGSEKCGEPAAGHCIQHFQRGIIYHAAGAGTQAVWGGVKHFYSARKAQDGALGYPTTAEACNGGGYCSQSFQYGVLQWIPGTGVRYRINTAAYCPAISTGAVKYRTADASRVTFAIADEYGSTRINFITCVRRADGSYSKEWGALGHAGESGFAGPGAATGPTWQKYSPTGSFTVTGAFGLGNPGTKLAYRQLNPYSRWGGRLNGNYNKYFESSADIFPDENMWYFATRPSHDYRQGAVINYNRPPDAPITMNAGFAIFLHGNNLPTWGCISRSTTATSCRPADREPRRPLGDAGRAAQPAEAAASAKDGLAQLDCTLALAPVGSGQAAEPGHSLTVATTTAKDQAALDQLGLPRLMMAPEPVPGLGGGAWYSLNKLTDTTEYVLEVLDGLTVARFTLALPADAPAVDNPKDKLAALAPLG